MAWVTDEQIKQARDVHILDYILRNEPDNIRNIGKCYRLKDHPSLSIDKNGWYWHSQSIGSRLALDFLVTVRGYEFVDAVVKLSSNINTYHEPLQTGTQSPLERKTFILPKRNLNNTRVIAYLLSRGIDRESIIACLRTGTLYESAKYHNCVFVGKDENGTARFATLRGVFSSYKCDVEGSDKRYGFSLPAIETKTNAVAVFEGAVDALSHQTLCTKGLIEAFDGWRLSLGSSSEVALRFFLKQHPNITNCHICTDNDMAGELAAERIRCIQGITTERHTPLSGNDWNDCLMDMKKTSRTQSQSHQKDRS